MNEQLTDITIFSPEVGLALREGRAVVALESTVIAHGNNDNTLKT